MHDAGRPREGGWRARAIQRARLPMLVFCVASLAYAWMLGDRRMQPSADNHYAHLAQSWLHGELGVVGNEPPGTNDWACYDTVQRAPCPPNQFRFPADQAQRYRWYVSFPPLPAVVMLPFVAARGVAVPDRLIWALLAGLAPALLFVLLRFLRETGRSSRRTRDDLALTALFAFGTVYFYTAVQGTVWFAAHVVAVPLLCLYVLWSLGARRPWLAGLMLGLAFMARPTAAFLVPLFVIEAVNASRAEGDAPADPDASSWRRLTWWLRAVRWRRALRSIALFSLPILAIGAVAMWMNEVRFHDPFEFGHSYLQIRWRPRIEKWGLFNFHYFAKNLAVFVASLPWLSAARPFVKISRHGLALWFTTPALLLVLWPKRSTATMVALYASAAVVCVIDLCYQNSGWVQFGYRFALDYMVVLFVLLAMGSRRFGPAFYGAMLFAIAVNTFGAVTFDRAGQFYDTDPTQSVIFQPD